MLEQFVKDLLKEKGLDKVDPAVYADLVDELSLKANEFINAKVIDAMDDQQAEAFAKLIGSNPTQEAVDKFTAQNMPNKNAVVASALMEFKSLYLGAV